MFFSIVGHEDLETTHVDVNQAFLEVETDKTSYIRIPQGWPGYREGFVLKLNRALYGMRRSAYLWYKAASKFLLSIGFESCPADACLFRRLCSTGKTLILLHVDDFAIAASSSNLIDQIVQTKKRQRNGLANQCESK